MEASVWMKFSYAAIPTSDRPVALTTPTVSVWSRPKGFPMAMAHSPTRSASEFPSLATGRSFLVSTRITARSVLGSAPTTLPLASCLSENFTLISSASLMT